ncbi:hypothetical protein UA08_08422 [Talaromyces atroroseus]|uniref:Copper-fist domain-containing protein n=1 Tax=Talaromyces atroroseus TaxID=1441469 RepID=A0A1Q5Q7L7_TALAT|nr:hypothetical protein UA08_08422 [Talaromyces atroroseus]OKL56207.1 hypothetical protein UA08_08422 [Talaromyces atroroseus]
MLIDGEKWACEACVRGHRVSSCHHSDRNLIHVNKKGRPVSQCPHCRGLRKSRTTHTKCDCGDKKKDHHGVDGACGDNGEAKCRCVHGQRCSCALKKEHLDPVPETGLPPPPHNAVTEIRKPRLTSTKSESTLTVFRDGHHKPTHKHNDMAHKCGLPYTIPRSHTIHGTSELAQRSADHLPLTLDNNNNNNNSLDASYFNPGADFDSFTSRRRVKSEHGSPELVAIPAPEQLVSEVPPLDLPSLSALDTGNNTTESMNPYVLQDPYQEAWLASPESEFPLSAGAFNAPPVDWSSFPLPASGLSTSVSQAPSYASFDLNTVSNPSYPGLTGSSSGGDASEVEELGPRAGLTTSNNDLYDLHSLSDGSDVDQYRISSASSFAGLPQARLLASSNLESINIDDFLRSANESTAALEQQLQASMAMESKTISTSPQGYAISQSQPSYPPTESISPAQLEPSQADMSSMLWASGLLDNSMPPPSIPTAASTAEDPFAQPPWAN